jgi:hypothetical protein
MIKGPHSCPTAIASAVIGISARTLQPRAAMTGGAAASAVGMALLATAVARHHLPVFLAATAISGAGYSLRFFGGLETINGAVPAEHRAGVLSTIYMLAYVAGCRLATFRRGGDRARARFRRQPRRGRSLCSA